MLKEELDVAAGGFPPANLSSEVDVHLSEPSDVLKVLFQYVAVDTDDHGSTLEHINFFLLLRVAEAAEKYEIYQAIAAIRPEFRKFFHSHSRQIFRFALANWDMSLIEELSAYTANIPMEEVAFLMRPCPCMFKRWCLWRHCHLGTLFKTPADSSREGKIVDNQRRWQAYRALGYFHFVSDMDPLNGSILGLTRHIGLFIATDFYQIMPYIFPEINRLVSQLTMNGHLRHQAFLTRLRTVSSEWEDRFADLFLPRFPEETSSHYQERLAYGKEIFLHPIIEGLEKIVGDKGVRATGFRLSSISFGAIESLLVKEYTWRVIIHGVTGALVQSPCHFDLDNPTSDEDVIDRLQRYYEEFKFIPPSEREEGLPEVLKEEGIDTDSWIAKATPYNALIPAAISFKMFRPPIVSPEMIPYYKNAIRSERKRFKQEAYPDLWYNLSVYEKGGAIVTGQLIDEKSVSIPDSIF
ncbi:hypothetical protein F5051DRAFT_446973 [Lentinula edodes]|nr:hypothetical protein F5051DRAFT_446973 [Lentinula edodes]